MTTHQVAALINLEHHSRYPTEVEIRLCFFGYGPHEHIGIRGRFVDIVVSVRKTALGSTFNSTASDSVAVSGSFSN